MNLSDHLVSQFAKVTKDTGSKNERTLYGTVVEKDGRVYVRFDGSDILTPVLTTVETLNGERVIVMIKNHTAIITGNITSPAARHADIQLIDDNTAAAARVATDYIEKTDGGIAFGDLTNEGVSEVRINADFLRFYIKNVAVFKPYYASGDTIDVDWTGTGFVSDSSSKVYFSISLAKPVIGNPSVTVTSSNDLQIRQNGLNETHSSPIYSATLSCDGGIINVVATLSSTNNVINDAPCGIMASIKVAFS